MTPITNTYKPLPSNIEGIINISDLDLRSLINFLDKNVTYVIYSLLKLFIGFVHAALIACQLTVIKHIIKLIIIVPKNTQILNVVWNVYFESHC